MPSPVNAPATTAAAATSGENCRQRGQPDERDTEPGDGRERAPEDDADQGRCDQRNRVEDRRRGELGAVRRRRGDRPREQQRRDEHADDDDEEEGGDRRGDPADHRLTEELPWSVVCGSRGDQHGRCQAEGRRRPGAGRCRPRRRTGRPPAGSPPPSRPVPPTTPPTTGPLPVRRSVLLEMSRSVLASTGVTSRPSTRRIGARTRSLHLTTRDGRQSVHGDAGRRRCRRGETAVHPAGRDNARLEANTTHERSHRFEFSGGHDTLSRLGMLHRTPTLETETETLSRLAAIGTKTIDTWLVACARHG